MDEQDEQLCWAGVAGQAAAVRDGRVTSAALTESLLRRIQSYDGRLNAFTTVLAEHALEEAAARDAAPTREPLHGVPLAVKEEFDVAGTVTTFGGRVSSEPAARDSAVVRRLRAAGAVVVGKTNMPEFGQWPFTESVAHGITGNPWDLRRSPGGSSGGTAAAVAAGLVPAGLGGDGGGSIRIPAACCGLFGLKPQRGRVSLDPRDQGWWALGTAGPLTRTVRDSALLYDVIRGPEPGDRYRAPEPVGSFLAAADAEPRRLRVGWSVRPAVRGVRPCDEHVQAVRDTADLLGRLGHDVREVDPGYPDATAAFVPQFLGGVREELKAVQHPERIERRTRQTVRLGSWARATVAAWAVRRGERVAAELNRVFDRCDLLLTPVLAHRPPPVGVLDGAGTLRAALAAMPMIAYTAVWNVAGNPAASVPAGFARDGLPLAVQLVGRTADEATVLSVAAQLERARPWADATPQLD
ncbi:MAG TPA: amidase [Nocardioidaceae bacterium]|nr:amidase [Nocardioidaceae bacterium]